MSARVKNTLGAVRIAAVVAVAIAGVATATVASLPKSAAIKIKKPEPAPLIASHYLDVLGLSPDALAAAGLNAEMAAQIKENLQAHLTGNGAGLAAAIDAWGAAHRDADLAHRAVQSSKGTVENMTAKQAALASALSAKNSALNAATAAALDQFDANIVTTLARIKANRPYNVPVQYLLVDRTDEQWRQLRDALSHRKTREHLGREMDADAVTIIANADAQPATVAAAAAVSENLTGIQQAMEQ